MLGCKGLRNVEMRVKIIEYVLSRQKKMVKFRTLSSIQVLDFIYLSQEHTEEKDQKTAYLEVPIAYQLIVYNN